MADLKIGHCIRTEETSILKTLKTRQGYIPMARLNPLRRRRVSAGSRQNAAARCGDQRMDIVLTA